MVKLVLLVAEVNNILTESVVVLSVLSGLVAAANKLIMTNAEVLTTQPGTELTASAILDSVLSDITVYVMA